jgi:hypothetical protein
MLAVLLAIPIPQLAPVAIILYVAARYAAEPFESRLAVWTRDLPRDHRWDEHGSPRSAH